MEVKEKTPKQLIVDGIGLIALGMFRLGSETRLNKPEVAYDAGMTASYIIRDMALEFIRNTKNKV